MWGGNCVTQAHRQSSHLKEFLDKARKVASQAQQLQLTKNAAMPYRIKRLRDVYEDCHNHVILDKTETDRSF
jgi:hypothetical protein